MNTSLLVELVALVDGSYTSQDISLTNWLTVRRVAKWGGADYDYHHRLCPSVCATHLYRCRLGAAENLFVDNGRLQHIVSNKKWRAEGDMYTGFFALGQVFKCDVKVTLSLFDMPSAEELATGANHKLIWLRRAEKLLTTKKARWTLGSDILSAYQDN